MNDDFSLIKDGLIAMAERSVGAMLAQRGPAFAPQSGLPGNEFGGGTYTERMADFATGYDGSETILAFRLDMSLLDGPDRLSD